MCDVPNVGLMVATNSYKGAIETLAIGGKTSSTLTPFDTWAKTCNYAPWWNGIMEFGFH
jgi:hypothetical protein